MGRVIFIIFIGAQAIDYKSTHDKAHSIQKHKSVKFHGLPLSDFISNKLSHSEIRNIYYKSCFAQRNYHSANTRLTGAVHGSDVLYNNGIV